MPSYSYIPNLRLHPPPPLPLWFLTRGLLEVFQLDFVPRDVWERPDSQMISWHLELPGNQRDVGLMRIYTTNRDFVGLAPMVEVSTPVAALCGSLEV